MKNNETLKAGDAIIFRLPVDTPQVVIEFLNDLKSPNVSQPKHISFGAECSNIFVRGIQEILDARLVKVTTPEPLTLK
jgi:hypothetical protein